MKKTIVIIFLILIIITMSQLKYPLDKKSESIIEKTVDKFLENKIFDLIWKRTFHWVTFFESLDGFSVTADAQDLTLGLVEITTSAAEDNTAFVFKQPAKQGVITFSERSRMRTTLIFASVADITAYAIVGQITEGFSYYGFKVVNNTLYGVSYDGTTEKTVELQTITTAQFNVEARYTPASKIVFYVDSDEKGVINENLPSRVATPNISLMRFEITTNAEAAKTMQFSFFEYLQSRNVLR